MCGFIFVTPTLDIRYQFFQQKYWQIFEKCDLDFSQILKADVVKVVQL